MAAPRFVAVGDVMVDVVSAEAPVPGERVHGLLVLRPGGSSANAAVWAAAYGAEAVVVGRVGDDLAGALVDSALRRRGVVPRLRRDPAAATGAVLVLAGGDGGIVAHRGASAGLVPKDVPDPLEADAVLVSGYTLLHRETRAAGEAAVARASGMVGVDAASPSLLTRLGIESFFASSAGADAVFADAEEAAVLTREEPEAAAAALGRRYRLACVKLGPDGAIAAFEGRVARSHPGPVPASDSLGAGDALAAAMLVRLAAGATLDEALAAGCEAGARAAASADGWP